MVSWNFFPEKFLMYTPLNFTQMFLASSKSRHRHLGVDIGISISIGLGIAKILLLSYDLFVFEN